MYSDFELLWQRLQHSAFRSKFRLNNKELYYLQEKGLARVTEHAADFVRKRLAAEKPLNDGKQTPWHGHPVFVAQHATATCCRGCLSKWHNIETDRELTKEEQRYIVTVVSYWLSKQHP